MMSSYLSRSNRLYSSSHIPDDQKSGYEKEVQVASARKKLQRELSILPKENPVEKPKQKENNWKTCSCFEAKTINEKEKIFDDNTPF